MKKSPQAMAFNALSQAPLAVVAQVAGKDPGLVLQQIEAQGYTDVSIQSNVRTIAGADKDVEKALMGAIFDPTEPKN